LTAKPLVASSVTKGNLSRGQRPSFTTPSPDCVITELTVQIPVDLQSDYGRLGAFPITTTVAISDGSRVSQSFRVTLLPQNVHIINTCDAGFSSPVALDFVCSFAVTHANGALVTPEDRAKPGEELVMYALGLGATSPAVPAGQPTPSPAPVAIGEFNLSFAYSGGLTSSSQSSPFLMPNPVFVGLAPGEVGLYQVNFTVQPPNGSISSCDGVDEANLRIVLSSNSPPSFHTARICVATEN
jgi:hypothetical protein